MTDLRTGADYCNAIVLQGVMARHLGRPVESCPHDDDTGEWFFWRYGFHGLKRFPVKQQPRGRGRDWTDGELAVLDLGGDLPRATLAAVLSRSDVAVRVKLCRRGRQW